MSDSQIDLLQAEKTAMDQLAMMHIKDNVVLRTQVELLKTTVTRQSNELMDLKLKLDELQKKLDEKSKCEVVNFPGDAA